MPDRVIHPFVMTPGFAQIIWEEAVIGLAIVGTDNRFVRVNQRMCQLVGYTQDELCARTWMDITDPQDTDADQAEVRRVISGESCGYTMFKRYLRKFGGTVPVELTVIPLRSESGEHVSMLLSQVVPIEPKYITGAQSPPTGGGISEDDREILSTVRFVAKRWKWVLFIILVLLGSNGANFVLNIIQAVGGQAAKLTPP